MLARTVLKNTLLLTKLFANWLIVCTWEKWENGGGFQTEGKLIYQKENSCIANNSFTHTLFLVQCHCITIKPQRSLSVLINGAIIYIIY